MMYGRPKPTLSEIRRQIVGDSRETEKLVARLIRLVREDEAAKTLGRLADARDRASSGAER